MVPNLRILIVDANQVRAAIIEEGLREAGYQQLIRISATTGLTAAIEAHDPSGEYPAARARRDKAAYCPQGQVSDIRDGSNRLMGCIFFRT